MKSVLHILLLSIVSCEMGHNFVKGPFVNVLVDRQRHEAGEFGLYGKTLCDGRNCEEKRSERPVTDGVSSSTRSIRPLSAAKSLCDGKDCEERRSEAPESDGISTQRIRQRTKRAKQEFDAKAAEALQKDSITSTPATLAVQNVRSPDAKMSEKLQQAAITRTPSTQAVQNRNSFQQSVENKKPPHAMNMMLLFFLGATLLALALCFFIVKEDQANIRIQKAIRVLG